MRPQSDDSQLLRQATSRGDRELSPSQKNQVDPHPLDPHPCLRMVQLGVEARGQRYRDTAQRAVSAHRHVWSGESGVPAPFRGALEEALSPPGRRPRPPDRLHAQAQRRACAEGRAPSLAGRSPWSVPRSGPAKAGADTHPAGRSSALRVSPAAPRALSPPAPALPAPAPPSPALPAPLPTPSTPLPNPLPPRGPLTPPPRPLPLSPPRPLLLSPPRPAPASHPPRPAPPPAPRPPPTAYVKRAHPESCGRRGRGAGHSPEGPRNASAGASNWDRGRTVPGLRRVPWSRPEGRRAPPALAWALGPTGDRAVPRAL